MLIVLFSSEVFDQVYDQMIQYLNDKDLYIFDGFAGANRKYNMVLELSMKKQVKIYLLETYLFDLKRNN